LEEPAAPIVKVEDMHCSVVKIDAAGSSKTKNVRSYHIGIPEDHNHTIICISSGELTICVYLAAISTAPLCYAMLKVTQK